MINKKTYKVAFSPFLCLSSDNLYKVLLQYWQYITIIKLLNQSLFSPCHNVITGTWSPLKGLWKNKPDIVLALFSYPTFCNYNLTLLHSLFHSFEKGKLENRYILNINTNWFCLSHHQVFIASCKTWNKWYGNKRPIRTVK